MYRPLREQAPSHINLNPQANFIQRFITSNKNKVQA
jgi:hypothetical protein